MENKEYLSDNSIISLFFLRDEEALKRTADRYGRVFLHLAQNFLCDSDAEEVLNDCYLRLWNSIPPAKPDSLKAYGLRIIRNLAVDRVRANSSAARGGGEAVFELDEAMCESIAEETPESISGLIDAFLRTQPERDRNAFILRYWYGCEESEVAQRCGLSGPGTRSMLFRMRKKLKRYLEKEGVSL